MTYAVICQTHPVLSRARALLQSSIADENFHMANGLIMESTYDVGVEVADGSFATTWMRASDGSGTRLEKNVKAKNILVLGDPTFIYKVQRLFGGRKVYGLAPQASDAQILEVVTDAKSAPTVTSDAPLAVARITEHTLNRALTDVIRGLPQLTLGVVHLLQQVKASAPQDLWRLEGTVEGHQVSRDFPDEASAQACLNLFRQGAIRVVSTDSHVTLQRPSFASFRELVGLFPDFSSSYVDQLLQGLVSAGVVGVTDGPIPESVSKIVQQIVADQVAQQGPVADPVQTRSYYVTDPGVRAHRLSMNSDRRALYQKIWAYTIAAYGTESHFTRQTLTYTVFSTGQTLAELSLFVSHNNPEGDPDWFSISGMSLLPLHQRVDGSQMPAWRIRHVSQQATPLFTEDLVSLRAATEKGLVANASLTGIGEILVHLLSLVKDEPLLKNAAATPAQQADAAVDFLTSDKFSGDVLPRKCETCKKSVSWSVKEATIQARCSSCKGTFKLVLAADTLVMEDVA